MSLLRHKASESIRKKCPVCGEEFLTNSIQRRTCTESCRVEMFRRTKAGQEVCVPDWQIVRDCAVCGKSFSTKGPSTQTCGVSCRAALSHRTSGPRPNRERSVEERQKHSINATKQHADRRQREWPMLDDRDWLVEQYQTRQLSQAEIGLLAGCSRNLVATALKRHNIERRRQRPERLVARMTGVCNPNWRGGIYNHEVVGFAGSGYQRMKRRKQLAEERGYVCEFCGKTEGRLELHHVTPFRYRQDHEDVLLLCTSCHAKAERVFRDEAAKFFVSNGCPGLSDAVSILRSNMCITTS